MKSWPKHSWYVLASVSAAAFVISAPASAQSGSDLMSLDDGSLKSELEMRYDASLAATLDPAVVNAIDTRYMWASEAKVQCAIAIGFMKNDLRDEDSIRKCDAAYLRWMAPPAPLAPPPPPPPPAACNTGNFIVFFDWDSAEITPEAASTLDGAIAGLADCSRISVQLGGYTDTSGSDGYNMGLAERRNAAVRSYLTARGLNDTIISSAAFGESKLRVPTADGVRELQNRRVELNVQ
ncbi:OmpA family protein [Croceicoccus ponticola]|uniref:OmpA family protein n=1 Tax=Croceicoccus ponticola TaxID=2217664 RepID=A0A437GU40_9SPHN|nr:OmpA family protein [Croceicoccus ponticola]